MFSVFLCVFNCKTKTKGRSHDLWFTSSIMYVIVVILVTLRIGLEFVSWTSVHLFVVALSFFGSFVVIFGVTQFSFINYNMVGVMALVYSSLYAWLVMLLVVSMPLLLDYVFNVVQVLAFPTVLQVLQERERMTDAQLDLLPPLLLPGDAAATATATATAQLQGGRLKVGPQRKRKDITVSSGQGPSLTPPPSAPLLGSNPVTSSPRPTPSYEPPTWVWQRRPPPPPSPPASSATVPAPAVSRLPSSPRQPIPAFASAEDSKKNVMALMLRHHKLTTGVVPSGSAPVPIGSLSSPSNSAGASASRDDLGAVRPVSPSPPVSPFASQ